MARFSASGLVVAWPFAVQLAAVVVGFAGSAAEPVVGLSGLFAAAELVVVLSGPFVALATAAGLVASGSVVSQLAVVVFAEPAAEAAEPAAGLAVVLFDLFVDPAVAGFALSGLVAAVVAALAVAEPAAEAAAPVGVLSEPFAVPGTASAGFAAVALVAVIAVAGPVAVPAEPFAVPGTAAVGFALSGLVAAALVVVVVAIAFAEPAAVTAELVVAEPAAAGPVVAFVAPASAAVGVAVLAVEPAAAVPVVGLVEPVVGPTDSAFGFWICLDPQREPTIRKRLQRRSRVQP